ncbi:MAG TPA: hypothetical protein VLT36_04935 [Candidatus Dormibacteraeota bacterium]|nr:hypothetical protein [Candidatus Dormibacteraeota bacterium]
MTGDIRQNLEGAPFEPFTIVTTSGTRYPVATPDHAGVNPRGSRVVVWFDDDSSVTISGLHIAAIEKGISQRNGGGEPAAGGNPE